MSVAVIKLGVGNTASVMFALERLGARARLTDDPDRVAEAERVIFPGVGAAGFAMRKLEERQLAATLRGFSRPLLGICLGQQVLFERSEEGDAAGLGLLGGAVAKLPASIAKPIPHMGWSELRNIREHPLLEGIASGAYAYFVHSYACPLTTATIAEAEYGAAFAAMVAHDNVYGCQFHPERSGAPGRRILENFLALPC